MIIPDAPISLLIADNGEMVIRRPPGFREEPGRGGDCKS